MSVFSDLKPKNKAVRNGFDRSFRTVFSNKVGKILPVMSLPTLPSSEYEIDLKQLLRTQPLQTAAFTGFSINYDFMYLPYNYMYQSFNQFIAQRENKQSTVQPSNLRIPHFALDAFRRFVLKYGVWDYGISEVSRETFLTRVADLCKVINSGYAYNLKVVPYVLVYEEHTPFESVLLNNLRALDMYGYGNYLPVMKQYAGLLRDVLDYNFSGQVFGVEYQKAVNAGLLQRGVSSLWEYYAFFVAMAFVGPSDSGITPYYFLNPLYLIDTFIDSDFNTICQSVYEMTPQEFLQYSDDEMHYPTLWAPMAYNKFFHEYYRNQYYDLKPHLYMWKVDSISAADYDPDLLDVINDYTHLFNFDDFVTAPSAFSISSAAVIEDTVRMMLIFNLWPHLYRKDLLTAVLPSQQFGDVSVMVTDDNFRSLIAQVEGATGPTNKNLITLASVGNPQPVRSVGTGSPFTTQFKFSPQLAISVLESRRADAMQRFKERMLRAGDKVDDIFEAHGWSAPHSEKMYEPIFLGSFDGRLDINTVAATTESANFEVGQLGANGVATVNGSKVHIKTSDFGVIMCVMYVVKDSEVDAYGLDRAWQLLEPFDFPYPEFQNISLDPVTRSQASDMITKAMDMPTLDVIGYLPRYMEYKTNLDKVHGEFHSGVAVPVPQIAEFGDVSTLNLAPSGVFSDWVTPRKDLNNVKSLSYLYQQIDVADNVFKLTASSRQDTDPFLINAFFDIKAVQPLTVIGLPI